MIAVFNKSNGVVVYLVDKAPTERDPNYDYVDAGSRTNPNKIKFELAFGGSGGSGPPSGSGESFGFLIDI
jgi:hypothetical protein